MRPDSPQSPKSSPADLAGDVPRRLPRVDAGRRGGRSPPRRRTRGSRAPRRRRALSVTGPWPGTTVSTSMPSIRSQAATQFASGPAHTIGVPPMNRMSPVKIVAGVGHVDERVARGVRRADLDQLDRRGRRRRGRAGRRTCGRQASARCRRSRTRRRSCGTGRRPRPRRCVQRRRAAPAAPRSSPAAAAVRGDDLGAVDAAGCRSSGRRWRGC